MALSVLNLWSQYGYGVRRRESMIDEEWDTIHRRMRKWSSTRDGNLSDRRDTERTSKRGGRTRYHWIQVDPRQYHLDLYVYPQNWRR